MYMRNVKQIVRGAEPGFDEHKYGFGNIVDLLRACQRDGLVRLDRDRQGVLRVFAGSALQAARPEDARVGEAAPVAVMDATPVDEAGEQVMVEAEAPAVPADVEAIADAAPAAAAPKTPRGRARKTAAKEPAAS